MIEHLLQVLHRRLGERLWRFRLCHRARHVPPVDKLEARCDDGHFAPQDHPLVGPCLHLVHRRHLHRPAPFAAAAEAASASPAEEDLEEMVDHFTSFALAGIRDIRRRLEAGQAGQAVQAAEPAGAGYVKQCRGKP